MRRDRKIYAQPDADKRLMLTIALVVIVLSTSLMLAMLWR